MHRTPEEPVVTYRILTAAEARHAARRHRIARMTYGVVLGVALIAPTPPPLQAAAAAASVHQRNV